MLTQLSFFILLTLILLVFKLYTLLNKEGKNNENARPGPKRMLILQIRRDSLFDYAGGPGETSGSGKGKKKRAKKGPGSNNNEEQACFPPLAKKRSSAIQKKIKQHYDLLVKARESNRLTADQIGKFDKCLADARKELQEKLEVIKRKFTISKALLLKADRSSYNRLCQQTHKLELELKGLEEDAFLYNWIQDQLRASPTYKTMLEISASTGRKEEASCLLQSEDADFSDMSFEELLALEKKDSFWQKNGKLKPCSS